MNICRIDRICDTSNNSVRIDERIRKIFVGNTDDFFVPSIIVESLPILSIVARSNADTTGCLFLPSTPGTSTVCLISEEKSSRRVLI